MHLQVSARMTRRQWKAAVHGATMANEPLERFLRGYRKYALRNGRVYHQVKGKK